MRTTSSLLLVSLLLSVTVPFAEAAPTRVPAQKGLAEYCMWIKLALKKGESVQPSPENENKFALSIDMLTKGSALCDAMLATSSPAAVPSAQTNNGQRGMLGYCFLIQTALKKGASVVPNEENMDRFNLSIDVLTKADALCDAMLTPAPSPLLQKGLFAYCLLIDLALKASETVLPSEENQGKLDATVDLLKKASAICASMQTKNVAP